MNKISFLLTSCLFIAVSVHCHTINRPSITKNFTMNSPGMLDITTSGGGIAVEGIPGKEAEVEVFIRKEGKTLSPSDPLVQNIREGFVLKMEKNGNDLVLYAKRKENDGRWRRISISFRVRAPFDMSTDLKTSGGGLKVSNLKGNSHDLQTSGGGIVIEDLSGKTSANTSGGGISVVNQEGDAELRTSGGSIRIIGSRGNIVGKTSGGSITLEDNDGRVDVSTSGGSIRISGKAKAVSATTSGGGITAHITGLSEELFLKASGGRINARLPKGTGMDLDLSAQKINIDVEKFSGSRSRSQVNGAMNGGGVPVRMRASGGNIDLSLR